jgi:hypothetical protein
MNRCFLVFSALAVAGMLSAVPADAEEMGITAAGSSSGRLRVVERVTVSSLGVEANHGGWMRSPSTSGDGR